jgi:hypothetical protein
MTVQLPAKWCVNRWDDGDVSLQIELGADYAVTLTCSREDGPRVTMWHGNGEHPFGGWDGQQTPEAFSAELDEIVSAQAGPVDGDARSNESLWRANEPRVPKQDQQALASEIESRGPPKINALPEGISKGGGGAGA